MHKRQGYKRRRPDSRSVLLHSVVFSGGVYLSAASECDSSIACATAAFRAVVRPDQVPLRGATTSIALIIPVSGVIRLVVVYGVLLRAARYLGVVRVGVGRGWIKGFVSSRFDSSQQCFFPRYMVDRVSGQ